jgi:hypothetical protein
MRGALACGAAALAFAGASAYAYNIVDASYDEAADELVVELARKRFALERLECRPAQVTLRAGPVQHANVLVPGP